MIVDAHVHISTAGEGEATAPGEDTQRANVEMVVKKMDKNGIDLSVCFPFAPGIERQKSMYRLIEPYKGRFMPLAYINPNDTDARNQLMYCLDELDFKGMKIHPWFANFSVADIPLLRPLFEILDERSLYCIVHCTSEDFRMHPVMFERLGNEFPNVTIQMAHMGEIMGSKYAIDVAKRLPNVYLDTACASFLADIRILAQCPDKVFMGTDYPFHQFEMEILKHKLAEEDTKDYEGIRKIMGGNFTGVFKLNP